MAILSIIGSAINLNMEIQVLRPELYARTNQGSIISRALKPTAHPVLSEGIRPRNTRTVVGNQQNRKDK